MAREKLDKERRGLSGYQGFFLALTLIVMIVIVLTAKDLTTGILLIGLITNFLIISSQLTLLGDRHVATSGGSLSQIDRDLASTVMATPPPGLMSLDAGADLMAGLSGTPESLTRRPGGRPPQAALNAPVHGTIDTPPRGARERFTGATTAPPGAPAPAFPNIPETTTLAAYPGAIDFGKTDQPVVGDEAPALGHVDWDAAARDGVPVGNPYDLDRIASPQAAAPCVDDDAIAFYDGDELMAYQARSRNDPERVWAGIHRRKALVDRYVGEELSERENTQWWGQGEV